MKPAEFKKAWDEIIEGTYVRKDLDDSDFISDDLEESVIEDDFASDDLEESVIEDDFVSDDFVDNDSIESTIEDDFAEGSAVDLVVLPKLDHNGKPIREMESATTNSALAGIQSVNITALHNIETSSLRSMLVEWMNILALDAGEDNYITNWNNKYLGHSCLDLYDLYVTMLQVRYYVSINKDALIKYEHELNRELILKLKYCPRSIDQSDMQFILEQIKEDKEYDFSNLFKITKRTGDFKIVNNIADYNDTDFEEKTVDSGNQEVISDTTSVSAFDSVNSSPFMQLIDENYPEFVMDLIKSDKLQESMLKYTDDIFVIIILSDFKRLVGAMSDAIASVLTAEDVYRSICYLIRSRYMGQLNEIEYTQILAASIFYEMSLFETIEEMEDVDSYNQLIAKFILLRCGINSEVPSDIGNSVFVFCNKRLFEYSLDAVLQFPELITVDFNRLCKTGIIFGQEENVSILNRKASCNTDLYVWLNSEKTAPPSGFNKYLITSTIQKNSLELSESASNILDSSDSAYKYEREFGIMLRSHNCFIATFTSNQFDIIMRYLRTIITDEPVQYTMYKFLYHFIRSKIGDKLYCDKNKLGELILNSEIVDIFNISNYKLTTYKGLLSDIDRFVEVITSYNKIVLSIMNGRIHLQGE